MGELVHNADVVAKLEKKGLITINKIEDAPEGAKIIFRAHGEPPETYQKAKEQKNSVMDLSCPKVLSIHKMAERYRLEGYYIIFIAEKRTSRNNRNIWFLR